MDHDYVLRALADAQQRGEAYVTRVEYHVDNAGFRTYYGERGDSVRVHGHEDVTIELEVRAFDRGVMVRRPAPRIPGMPTGPDDGSFEWAEQAMCAFAEEAARRQGKPLD